MLLKGFSFFLVFLLIYSPFISYSTAQILEAAVLVKMTGDVKALRAGNRLALKPGTALKQNDIIYTDKASTADVRFPSGEIIRVMENSRIKIKQCEPNNVSLTLNIGNMFNIIPSGKNTKYNLTTPTAAAGVRGTIFHAEVAKTGKTTIMVKQGAVGVSNPSVSPKETLVSKHQKTVVARGKLPTIPVALTGAEIALFGIIVDLLPAGTAATGAAAAAASAGSGATAGTAATGAAAAGTTAAAGTAVAAGAATAAVTGTTIAVGTAVAVGFGAAVYTEVTNEGASPPVSPSTP